MAPSFSATPLIIQMEDLQVINMYRGPCYLGLVFCSRQLYTPPSYRKEGDPFLHLNTSAGASVVILNWSSAMTMGGGFLCTTKVPAFSCFAPQMTNHVSKAPCSVLISELRQPLWPRVRAEEGLLHPASPAKLPCAGPLPLAQTMFPTATTNAALVAAAPGVWLGGWACTNALWSRYLSWTRQCCVDRLFPVCRAVRLGDIGRVSYGSVQGPLGGAHIREGRVQPRSLAGMSVVWTRGLVVSIIGELGPGCERGKGRAVMRETEGSIGDMGTSWSRFSKVAPCSPSLTLDLGLGGIWTERGAMVLVLLLLGEPCCWVSAGCCQSWGDAISVRGWITCHGSRCPSSLPHPRVPVRREVLVKLIDIEWFHVDQHLMAHFTNVDIAKIYMRFPRPGSNWASLSFHCTTGAPIRRTLAFPIPHLTGLRFGLGSGWRCWRTVTLTCRDTENIAKVSLLVYLMYFLKS